MVNPFFFIKVAKGYLFFYKTDYKLKLKTIQQILKIFFNLILIACMLPCLLKGVLCVSKRKNQT